jgi:hypothetical protein
MVGTPVVGILWVSGQANTTVIGIIFGAPVALVLAIGRLMGRAKQVVEAAPREIHNHMSGPVYQDHSTTETKTKNFSVTAETNNNPKEKP